MIKLMMNCPDLIEQAKKMYAQSPLDYLQKVEKIKSPINSNIDKSCNLKSIENSDLVN